MARKVKTLLRNPNERNHREHRSKRGRRNLGKDQRELLRQFRIEKMKLFEKELEDEVKKSL